MIYISQIKHIFWLAILLIVGCGTYSMEGAKGISPEKLGHLETKIENCSDCLIVHSIDGKSRSYGLFSSYALVPGERAITVMGNGQLGFAMNATDIVFAPEAMKNYKFTFSGSNSGYWSAIIIDKATGERVDYEQHQMTCKLQVLGGWKCNR